MRRILLSWAAVAVCLVGCKNNRFNGEPERMLRFDLAVADYESLDSVGRHEMLTRYAVPLAMVAGEASDSAARAYARSRAVAVFGRDIKARFHEDDSLSRVLGELRSHMAGLLPDVAWPTAIYGGISTYNQSILLADSAMFVGLNHYLGVDYPGYDYFEPYQRKVKTAAHVPYDVAEALVASAHPLSLDSEPTLLNRMLYEGAVSYAVMKSVPKSSLAELLGYSTEQLAWADDNCGRVWMSLVEGRKIYSTDPVLADALCRPAPSSAAIHPQAPGRIGRYLGYKIVESYAKSHPDVTPSELLSPAFYGDVNSLLGSNWQ